MKNTILTSYRFFWPFWGVVSSWWDWERAWVSGWTRRQVQGKCWFTTDGRSGSLMKQRVPGFLENLSTANNFSPNYGVLERFSGTHYHCSNTSWCPTVEIEFRAHGVPETCVSPADQKLHLNFISASTLVCAKQRVKKMLYIEPVYAVCRARGLANFFVFFCCCQCDDLVPMHWRFRDARRNFDPHEDRRGTTRS